MSAQAHVEKLVREALSGHRLSLARLISKVENRDPDLPHLMHLLFPQAGHAHVLGITGPPGAGKSTLTDGLIREARAQGKRVAVVAVDPSSPFSGGAILGDRIRMQDHTSDDQVFIRSLGTRGKHGGLSHSTKEVVTVLDAAGFDLVIVETAGVGQTELEILRLAHTVSVVLVPESGDSIQVMKAGLMEIADVFVVNKSDRPEADKMVKELVLLIELNPHDAQSWMIPVVKTQAQRGMGTQELLSAVWRHREWLEKSGKLTEKRAQSVRTEVFDILSERLQQTVMETFKTRSGQDVLDQLLKREIDPYKAADLISSV